MKQLAKRVCTNVPKCYHETQIELCRQSQIGLRSLEQLLDDFQESLASRPELDHARGDRFAHEFSIIKSAGEPRSQRQRFAEFLLDARRVKLGKPLRQRLREQLAGAHRIIDTLTGDGVNKPAGISRQRPTRAAQPEAAPCVHTERGKQVAVDLSALKGI